MRRSKLSAGCRPFVVALVLLGFLVATSPSPRRVHAQGQCFSETRFCIEEPAFQQYFASRGGARILGFPVSREFRLEGFTVQFFQRVVLQLQGTEVARLNVLDPGVLPVMHANESQFPAPDPDLAAEAPGPNDPGRVGGYLQSVSPDTWNDLPVGFLTLFNTTVPAEGVSPDIRTLLNLEIWGLPTSRPAFDPRNGGFVYQRFQRGIMHFRADCRCTDGILVGDYLKAVLTGRDLPGDLAADMQGSRYFRQYAPGAAGWVARPQNLPDSDLTDAFEAGIDGTPTTSPVTPTATPVPATDVPTATPVPATATATSLKLASLSGTVAADPPPPAGVRVLLSPLFLDTDVDSSGGYRLTDVPLGDYEAYAIGPNGQSSDRYPVSLKGDLVLNMQVKQLVGQPRVYIGRVLGPNNAPVSNAVVWRVGGAGRTTTDADGRFRLVDAFGDLQDHLSPARVVFVAASGDRWASAFVDFNQAQARAEIKLSRQGKVPPAPKQLLDVRALASNPSQRQLDGGPAVYFTALWLDQHNAEGAVVINPVPGGGHPNGVQNQDCYGDCNGYTGNIRVIKLPAQGKFTLAVDPTGGAPNWAEAQVVAGR